MTSHVRLLFEEFFRCGLTIRDKVIHGLLDHRTHALSLLKLESRKQRAPLNQPHSFRHQVGDRSRTKLRTIERSNQSKNISFLLRVRWSSKNMQACGYQPLLDFQQLFVEIEHTLVALFVIKFCFRHSRTSNEGLFHLLKHLLNVSSNYELSFSRLRHIDQLRSQQFRQTFWLFSSFKLSLCISYHNVGASFSKPRSKVFQLSRDDSTSIGRRRWLKRNIRAAVRE